MALFGNVEQGDRGSFNGARLSLAWIYRTVPIAIDLDAVLQWSQAFSSLDIQPFRPPVQYAS